jgi:hypothetical protein
LKTHPPPSTAADAIVLSTPRAEHASGQAPLEAVQISPKPRF